MHTTKILLIATQSETSTEWKTTSHSWKYAEMQSRHRVDQMQQREENTGRCRVGISKWERLTLLENKFGGTDILIIISKAAEALHNRT